MNHPSARSRTQATDGSGAASGPPLFLGVDLGKVTTSLAVGELGADGDLRVVETRAERHLGDPLRPFLELYRELDAGRLAGIAATGVYGERLGEPALGGVPEEIAQEQAAAWLYPDGPVNVVRVGGGGYSVLTRNAAGNVRYEANERCSAGTGETVEGLCARLGRSLDDAVALAEASPDGVTVTSRCAVFAKSELTHFANQGESHGRIFRGLFEGVARNVHSLYDKSKIDGPVVLIGHGALITPIAAGVAALSEAPVEVAEQAGVFEALGALRFAAARAQTATAAAGPSGAAPAASDPPIFPADPEALVRPVRSRIGRLEPADRGPGSVVTLGEATFAGRRPATRTPRPSSASTSAPRAPRPRSSTPPPARSWRASTGARRATPSRPPRRWWPRSPRWRCARWSPSASPAPGATPRRPCSAPRSRTSGSASRCRTRSSPTPRPPRRSTRTAAAVSPSSRSAARTPSSSTSRTAASWTPT